MSERETIMLELLAKASPTWSRIRGAGAMSLPPPRSRPLPHVGKRIGESKKTGPEYQAVAHVTWAHLHLTLALRIIYAGPAGTVQGGRAWLLFSTCLRTAPHAGRRRGGEESRSLARPFLAQRVRHHSFHSLHTTRKRPVRAPHGESRGSDEPWSDNNELNSS